MHRTFSRILVIVLLLCAVSDYVQFDTLNPEAPMNGISLVGSAPAGFHNSHATSPRLPDDECIFCGAALTRIGPALQVAATETSFTPTPPSRIKPGSLLLLKRPPRV